MKRFLKGPVIGIVTLVVVTGLAGWIVIASRQNQPIEASKDRPWQKEFRVALQKTCVESTGESLQQKGLSSQSDDVRRFEKNYCDCLLERVEQSHVLATEYQGLNQSQVIASQELVRNFDQYLQSEAGLDSVRVCKSSALSEFSVPDGVSANQSMDATEKM